MIGFAEVNGVALRYRLSGQGGRRLVLVHEMGGTLESWSEVAAIMAADYQILTYDTRGAGLSEKIRGEVEIDDLASDLLALLDHLQWDEQIGIAGCAIGAATAIRAIARQPARFDALAALSPALGVSPERRPETIAAGDRLVEEGVRAVSAKTWDRAFPHELRTDAARVNAVYCRKIGNDPQSFAALYRMVARMDVAPDLALIRCPTLFLAGQLDQTRPPEMVQKLAKSVPGAQFEILMSGHVMPALTPEPVAKALQEFYSSCFSQRLT
jgi:pimeloyl-ACP methyl ester carboxylesterase